MLTSLVTSGSNLFEYSRDSNSVIKTARVPVTGDINAGTEVSTAF